MRVLIIEDEAPAFRRLQRIIENLRPTFEIVEVLDTVKDSVEWLSNQAKPDLIFMDIQLADGLSFEIFEETDVQSPVIFTTAYDEYALKAFKVNSIDYLLKPIDEEKLGQSLSKFEQLKANFSSNPELKEILRSIQPEERKYKSRFLVKSRDRLVSIQLGEIAYFFTENGIVYLFTKSGDRFVFDRPLDQIEEQMDPNLFLRLNRQCLGHIEAISTSFAYDKGKVMVEMNPKTTAPIIVSRDKAGEFKRWLDMD